MYCIVTTNYANFRCIAIAHRCSAGVPERANSNRTMVCLCVACSEEAAVSRGQLEVAAGRVSPQRMTPAKG